MPLVLQLILGLLCLSFLVFIHELGHFLVAKKAGVNVKTFSIGFGKKLIKYHFKGTDYCISAIPFGGYVAMQGESPGSSNDEDPHSFSNKSIKARAAIALGGPVVNIVFAFLVLIPVFMLGYPEKRMGELKVGMVEQDGAADRAGMKPGDAILAIEGVRVKGWESFMEQVGMSLGKPLTLQIEREGQNLDLEVTPEEFIGMGIGHIGVRPLDFVLAGDTPTASEPAGQAGFLKGDTLLEANGIVLASANDVIREVSKAKETPVEFLVGREGGRKSLTVTPKFREDSERYLIGLPLTSVIRNPDPIVKRNFIDAIPRAYQEAVAFAVAPFKFIKSILTGGIKVKAMSGPVGIVQVIGAQAESGFTRLLWLLGFISMNLGIMNLLPLAITDGGILVFLGIEAIRGRPLPAPVMQKIQSVFFALFIMLFIYVTFQDALRFKLLM